MSPSFGQHSHGWSPSPGRPNMDVQRTTRERVFSILNDSDCPSFQIRQKQASLSLEKVTLPGISSFTFAPKSERQQRPSLTRLPQFNRKNSVSSVGSPPLLRYHSSSSSSSSKSSSSMDSTPSPITPAYNYNDPSIIQYNTMLRQDPTLAYLPSPTGITPFVEQGLMIAPQDAFSKGTVSLAAAPGPQLAFPPLPIVNDVPQVPTPALSTDVSTISSGSSASQSQPATATSVSANALSAPSAPSKKNKYPCPYASSHSCSATFTTSGHAARHGKKHTGEKGVHCPVCDKAFTRKDNMKQHERTHKNKPANGEDKKSKAQKTREANEVKELQKQDQEASILQVQPAPLKTETSVQSLPSDATLAGNPLDTPVDISPTFFNETIPQIVMHPEGLMPIDPTAMAMYPPLIDEVMLQAAVTPLPMEKLDPTAPQPPSLVRGFSDLDTLAQAAESAVYDPFFQQQY